MEKKILVLTVFLAVALVTTTASAWDMRWMNAPNAPLYGPNGVTGNPADYIPAGALVQLIADGGNGVIDDPMTLLSPAQILPWLAGGALPVGDDTLVASTDATNPQAAYLAGYFAAVYIQSNLAAGAQLYTRFFNANPSIGDWYGEIGPDAVGGQDPSGTFYVLPNSPFPDYTIMRSAHTDKLITPEPATLAIGAVGLLLGLLRRKR